MPNHRRFNQSSSNGSIIRRYYGINSAFSFVCFDVRPYFRRRSNAFEGMAVASFLGVSSGVYIWKPFFEEMKMNRLERERREREEAGETNPS